MNRAKRLNNEIHNRFQTQRIITEQRGFCTGACAKEVLLKTDETAITRRLSMQLRLTARYVMRLTGSIMGQLWVHIL